MLLGKRDGIQGSCLDAVCKLLQSFSSYRFHRGDECGQLVLGARRCPLKTRRPKHFTLTKEIKDRFILIINFMLTGT